jgi:ABC-type transporter Mla subunit MlaD
MADDVAILQLGQLLTNLNNTMRQLAERQNDTNAAVDRICLAVDRLTTECQHDRAQMRKFAAEVKNALLENASSKSQELRAARIDTPVPPVPPPVHGRPRP